MADIYENVDELSDTESIVTDSETEEIEDLPSCGLNISKEEADRWFKDLDRWVSFHFPQIFCLKSISKGAFCAFISEQVLRPAGHCCHS